MFKVPSLLACLAATGICQAALLPVVTILAPDPVATEGDHRDPARLTLVRSGDTASSLAVRLLIGGTATPGTDYLAIASPITIPAGASSREIVIFP